MLNEWIFANWSSKDRTAVEATLSAFKAVRQLRYPDARVFLDDTYDRKFLHKQLELAYKAVRMLRIILESNPQIRPHANISQCRVRNVLI